MAVMGFLAILLSALPLNGYFMYIGDPGSFHQDEFIGSAWHLLAGAVPFCAGILPLAFSRASTRLIFLIPLCGIPCGLVLALPALITGSDHHVWLACLSIFTVGCVLAVPIRAARLIWRPQAPKPSGNGA